MYQTELHFCNIFLNKQRWYADSFENFYSLDHEGFIFSECLTIPDVLAIIFDNFYSIFF